jgi:hypothetical protein
MAAAVMIVVACGSSTPTSPLASGATASAPSRATSSTSLNPNPTPGLEAPTPEPSRVVRIPEVPCPTTYGLAGETMPPLQATMTATLTPAVAALVTYYGNGTLILLGPKDWHCEARVGADGAASMAIAPPDQPARSGSPSPDEQAVSATTGGACAGCVASMACGLFPEAGNLFMQPGFVCRVMPPGGEQVTRPRPGSAVFKDPPGVGGTGDPSGGRYRAFGFIVFNPGTAAGGSGQTAPSALKVTCTLPDAMAQICDELIEGIGQRPRPSGG